ncbi:MAG: hypothetical protein K9L30_15480 [Desulfobacterales bacterium]|nr:hypothetical protein [Desulfobacterales bacterium]
MNKKKSKVFAKRLKQLPLYLNRIFWLCKDVLHCFWKRVLGVVILNIIGIGFAGGSFGCAFLILRHLEKGKPIAFHGIKISLSDNFSFTLISFGITVLIGILSSAILYYSEWKIAQLAIDYQKKCTSRIFEIISNPVYDGWQKLTKIQPQDGINRLISSSVKMTSMSVRRLLQGILPFATLIFATISMVYLNPVLSLVIVPIALLYVLPLYFVNREVSHHHKEFISTISSSRAPIKICVNQAINTPVSYQEKIDSSLDSIETDEYNRATILFFLRKLAVKRVQMINTILFFVCLGALFIYFIFSTSETERNWSLLVAFLVALRFAIQGLKQITGVFIKLSRFFSEYTTFSEFIDGSELIKKNRMESNVQSEQLPQKLDLVYRKTSVSSSDKKISMKKGNIVYVFQPSLPKYGDLKNIAAVLESAIKQKVDIFQNSIFQDELFYNTAKSIYEISRDDIQKDLQKFDDPELQNSNFENTILSQINSENSNELIFLASILKQKKIPDILFMTSESLKGLSAEFVSTFLMNNNLYKIVLSNDLSIVLKNKNILSKVDGIIITDSKDIIGLGNVEWFESVSDEVTDLFQNLKIQKDDLDEIELDLDLDDE